MVGLPYPNIYSPELKEKKTYLDSTLGVRMYTCIGLNLPWCRGKGGWRRGCFARKMTFLAKKRLCHPPLRSNVSGIFSAVFFVVCKFSF